jgi:hypothetical protein
MLYIFFCVSSAEPLGARLGINCVVRPYLCKMCSGRPRVNDRRIVSKSSIQNSSQLHGVRRRVLICLPEFDRYDLCFGSSLDRCKHESVPRDSPQ